MKKKITALLLSIAALMTTTAFADTVSLTQPTAENENYTVYKEAETRAILVCYDNDGTLIYSKLLKSEDGTFDVPAEYVDTTMKIYFVSSKELKDVEVNDKTDAEPTTAPTAEPTTEPTAAPTAAPTVKPTSTPLSSTPYEKEVDSIYAPALVEEVETAVDANGDDVYAVTLFYCGKEMKIGIDEDLTISTAPEEYSYMAGKDMSSLEKGDVICLTANIAGDTIRNVDFIFRPTEEDIATGETNYGTDFEKLFSQSGQVAGKWSVLRYGAKASSDRYQYAFGIIGSVNGSSLTLINKSGDTNKTIDIDVSPRAYVYTCDVSGKEYEVEIGDTSDITATIPKSVLSNDTIELTDIYSYNYALVRVVDGTATEVILYNNYND